MSYTIEYDRVCFAEPEATEGMATGQKNLYLFIQDGCNNVTPRFGNWRLASHGWNYCVIGEVCKRAGDTEGGMIKPNNRNTSPESYLKMYRKVIADAIPLTKENLQQRMGLSGFRLSYIEKPTLDNASKYIKEKFEKLVAAGWRRSTEWSNKYYVYSRPFVTMDDFTAFIDSTWAVSQVNGCLAVDAWEKRAA